MKIKFIKDNGEVIETTLTELSRYLDGTAAERMYAVTSGAGFSNSIYDFIEEKQQEDENSLHARLRNVKHDDTN